MNPQCELPGKGLLDTLNEIAALEEEHNLLGARFAVRKGANVDTEDGASYVLEVTGMIVALSQRKDQIPRPKDLD